jgi:hypothetical protein
MGNKFQIHCTSNLRFEFLPPGLIFYTPFPAFTGEGAYNGRVSSSKGECVKLFHLGGNGKGGHGE